MYSVTQLISTNRIEQTVKPIHNLGNHLIMDFMDTDFDLSNFESLDLKVKEIISKTSLIVEGQLQKKYESSGTKILYMLSDGHLSIRTWPQLKACALDFYHSGS